MTDSELAELVRECPVLYHMAERGSWPSIRTYGLLSTTGLLDRYQITGARRASIESERRPLSVSLEQKGLGRAVIRDQFPMHDSGLMRCLKDGLLPRDWYQTLNGKVFFWLTKQRLLALLNAGNYRHEDHDVLTVEAKPLIESYRDRIWLCPMNSGCTRPYPHARGNSTFQRISDYPYSHWKAKRKRGERVVELAVDYAVPDIERFVTRVVRMRAGTEMQVLYEP